MKRPRCGNGVAVLALALMLAALPTPAGEAPRFHADVEAVRSAAQRITIAIALDDPATARKEFDFLEKACPRIPPEKAAVYGKDLVNADRAYHLALARAREFSGAGDGELTLEANIGVQKVCRACHVFAREQGFWPSAEPGDEGR